MSVAAKRDAVAGKERPIFVVCNWIEHVDVRARFGRTGGRDCCQIWESRPGTETAMRESE